MQFDSYLLASDEAAAVLEPLFKLFTDTVGFPILLEEAEQHGKDRAELPIDQEN